MVKQVLLFLCLSLCSVSSVYPQGWQILANSPASASFRHDDVYFISPDTGWVCNVDGNIYSTQDGGESWTKNASLPDISFRCIGFVSPLKGWAGNLGPGRWSPTIDTLPLYETNDGGNTWEAVTTIQGTLPKGICGINVVNDSVVYAVGRVGGPSYLLKTTNGGQSWTSIDMNPHAFMLIDCWFFSADTGFVVGGYPGPSYAASKYRILYTVDGGASWQPVAQGTDSAQQCWKIHFVNRQLGYVSIENNVKRDSVPYLKTTDGGMTWVRSAYPNSQSYGAQGVGFVSEQTGWIGGGTGDTRMTADGGNSWAASNVLNSFNRFRKVNNHVAYAVGRRVWKYTNDTITGMAEEKVPEGFRIESLSPNPFAEDLELIYHIPQADEVVISLYDFAGRPVGIFKSEKEAAGIHHLKIHIPHYGYSHFYLVINYKGFQLCRKIFAEH